VYKVTFRANWSPDNTQPGEYPAGAHWSPFYGAAHAKKFRPYQPGEKASPGIKDVAEFGSTFVLGQEFDAAGGVVGQRFNGGGLGAGSGKASAMVRVTPFKRYITGVSMMAPSPDWFAGVRASLCDTKTGEWRKKIVKSGQLYDAGTDSGKTFFAADEVTTPFKNIKKIRQGNPKTPLFYNPNTDNPPLFDFKFVLQE